MKRFPITHHRLGTALALALLLPLLLSALGCRAASDGGGEPRPAAGVARGLLASLDGPLPAEFQRLNQQTDTLTFAETWEFWTAPTLLARILDLYGEVGLEVRVAKYPTGLAAKNGVLSKSADLGLVADTPIALAGFQNEPVTLIATYFQSDRIVKLVARNGNDKSIRETLETETIGYVAGTISQLVMEQILEQQGLERSRVRTVALRPTGMVFALARRDIGAFVGWEPMPIYARRELGEEHVRVLADQLYTVSLHLVTRPEVIEEKRVALLKFLQALDLAHRLIAENPERTRRLVENALRFEEGELKPFWDASYFRVKLDKEALVSQLESEARWLVEAGIAHGSKPTYDRYVNESVYDAFQSLDPGRKG